MLVAVVLVGGMDVDLVRRRGLPEPERPGAVGPGHGEARQAAPLRAVGDRGRGVAEGRPVEGEPVVQPVVEVRRLRRRGVGHMGELGMRRRHQRANGRGRGCRRDRRGCRRRGRGGHARAAGPGRRSWGRRAGPRPRRARERRSAAPAARSRGSRRCCRPPTRAAPATIGAGTGAGGGAGGGRATSAASAGLRQRREERVGEDPGEVGSAAVGGGLELGEREVRRARQHGDRRAVGPQQPEVGMPRDQPVEDRGRRVEIARIDARERLAGLVRDPGHGEEVGLGLGIDRRRDRRRRAGQGGELGPAGRGREDGGEGGEGGGPPGRTAGTSQAGSFPGATGAQHRRKSPGGKAGASR